MLLALVRVQCDFGRIFALTTSGVAPILLFQPLTSLSIPPLLFLVLPACLLPDDLRLLRARLGRCWLLVFFDIGGARKGGSLGIG